MPWNNIICSKALLYFLNYYEHWKDCFHIIYCLKIYEVKFMFSCPYAKGFPESNRKLKTTSTIRLLHAAPNAPNVDIYANDKLIIGNLSYGEFTKYMTVPSGNYNIKVYAAGKKGKPVFETDVNIMPKYVFTGAIIGTMPDLSLLPIPDPANANAFGTPCMRFVHLSPNSPAVDVTLQSGAMLFKNVKYKDYTLYACIPSGTYSIQVKIAGTNNVILTLSDAVLNPNTYYSIYAIGLVNENPKLQALLSVDNNPEPVPYRKDFDKTPTSEYRNDFPRQSSPPGPPPSAVPNKAQGQGAQQLHGYGAPATKAVEPGTIKPCLYKYVYIWPKRGHGFWAWLTNVGRKSASGYKWRGYRWVYFGIDLREIDSFECY